MEVLSAIIVVIALAVGMMWWLKSDYRIGFTKSDVELTRLEELTMRKNKHVREIEDHQMMITAIDREIEEEEGK